MRSCRSRRLATEPEHHCKHDGVAADAEDGDNVHNADDVVSQNRCWSPSASHSDATDDADAKLSSGSPSSSHTAAAAAAVPAAMVSSLGSTSTPTPRR